jgi:hypothetical protein
MNSKSASIFSLALLAALPAIAARVYLPIVDGADGTTAGTGIVVSNTGGEDRGYAAVIASAAATEGWRDQVAADQAVRFTPPSSGLMKLELGAGLTVDGWLENRLAEGGVQYARLPLITDYSKLAAGSTAYLPGLERDTISKVADLAVVNIEDRAATCQIGVYRADSSRIGQQATIRVDAGSERRFADALGILGETETLGARAEVSCNTPFYAYATVRRGVGAQVSVVAPAISVDAPAITSCLSGGPSSDQIACYLVDGVFHTPDKGNEKAIIKFPISAAVNTKQVIFALDVKIGPWNPRNKGGAHSPVWLHRGKFASNTISNVNLQGPSKHIAKYNHNIGMPRGERLKSQAGFTFEVGHTYRLAFYYQPYIKTSKLEILENGVLLKTVTGVTTSGKYLDIPDTGLVAEFGHHKGQHPPEVEFPKGWILSNYRMIFFKLQ